MRSLIFRIFLCYWIAAGLVIVYTDLRPHKQLHRQEATDALTSALKFQARTVLLAYERQGCAAAQPMLAGSGDQMFIASEDGRLLCPGPQFKGLRELVAKALPSKIPIATNYRSFQLVALPVSSPTGKRYVLLMQNHYVEAISFYGLSVGPTTVAISGVVTLLLAILLAVPIKRLRAAAQDISNGHLESRVHWGELPGPLSSLIQSDSIQRLMVDFNHMAERLQSLVDVQRIFLRDVSHELRSPLARLSVALELAREAGTASMKSPLDRIEDEAARLNDLIGQLLSLSYMETLQEIPQCENLSLGDMVTCMMPDIQYEATGRQCEVVVRSIEDCPVQGDAVLLQRAFENVVRNAIQYTPQKGLVEIDVETVERNGSSMAVLRIGDSGPGVPSDELSSILKPFYRVDKSRQRSTGGFGVGLAIADRAIKLHAGEIIAWNKPEGGLVVEMSFPVSPRYLSL